MNEATERLLFAVQNLSLARDLGSVMEIVRHAARDLGRAEGATFVLRDGDCCFYAEEDAISPLWKGKRFPMSACISGWVMLNRQTVAMEDIYADTRVPVDAYRPTFVRSLVMVPIRVQKPIGAIGNYWSQKYTPPKETIRLLEALANFTSIAIENANLYTSLEQKVAERTQELFLANQELEAFNYSVTHDLRAPLRTISGFSTILEEDYSDRLDAEARKYLDRIRGGCLKMGNLIDDLLRLSRVTREAIHYGSIDLSSIAREIAHQLSQTSPNRHVDFIIQEGLLVRGDRGLLTVLMENLLSNAYKYTSKTSSPEIEIGCMHQDGQDVYSAMREGVLCTHGWRQWEN